MTLLFVAMTQAISSVPPEKIDLTLPQACQAQRSTSDEIVVCGRTNGASHYRIKQPAPRPSSNIPKAQVQLADGISASAETEHANVGGFPSNRLMVGLKIKF